MSSYTSYSTSSYTSSSSSTNNNGGQPHTTSYTENANYNSQDGGKVERIIHQTGQPAQTQTEQIPVQGRVAGSGNDSGIQNRIEDVTDKEGQDQRDREYLEKMEDEYAKREGGA